MQGAIYDLFIHDIPPRIFALFPGNVSRLARHIPDNFFVASPSNPPKQRIPIRKSVTVISLFSKIKYFPGAVWMSNGRQRGFSSRGTVATKFSIFQSFPLENFVTTTREIQQQRRFTLLCISPTQGWGKVRGTSGIETEVHPSLAGTS